MGNKLLNNNNTIMLIMSLIIIALLFYIIKITRKVNKEGFAPALSSFGGVIFTAEDTATPKTLNITGDISSNGAITANSITIGDAKLTWDSVNKRLTVNQGVNAKDILTSGEINSTAGFRTPGFVSVDKIRGHSDESFVAFRDQVFIPQTFTRYLRGQGGGAYQIARGTLDIQNGGVAPP